MTHDAGNLAAMALAVGYVATAAAAPQSPVSDHQLVVLSCGSGLVGGLVSMLMSGANLAVRELAKRMLASGMLAPAIVALALAQITQAPTLLVVVAIAGVAGLLAYPLAEAIPKLAPGAIKTLLRRWLGQDGGQQS